MVSSMTPRGAMLLLGVVQSPMVPGREMLKMVWCPPGPERALSLHVVFFGHGSPRAVEAFHSGAITGGFR